MVEISLLTVLCIWAEKMVCILLKQANFIFKLLEKNIKTQVILTVIYDVNEIFPPCGSLKNWKVFIK